MKMDIGLNENATCITKLRLFIILIVCQIIIVVKLYSLNCLVVEKSSLVESKEFSSNHKINQNSIPTISSRKEASQKAYTIPPFTKYPLQEFTKNPWIERNISYINGVPYVAYGFWFGNEMLGERAKVYKQLIANIGPPFYLITISNISDFESPEHPFNPAVKYTLKYKKGLSGNHLSDYLRQYVSYHYGGAYHDIKLRLKTQSISKYWDIFEDPNIWVVGMPNLLGGAGDQEIFEYIMKNEGNNTDLMVSKDGKWNEDNMIDSKLICNTGWIARPKTTLFRKVNHFVEMRLNGVFRKIQANPVDNFSRCCLANEVSGYPLDWTAVQGKVFHPYQLVYFSHINRSMQRYEKSLYRHESEDV